MMDISVGAVGAATIAGFVSLFGLVIGKEQKVSEFRQAWIDDLRKCLVAYLVNINAISDAVRLKKAGKPIDDSLLVENYKALNEANHGIILRVNLKEEPSKAVLKSMADFDALAKSNDDLTPEKLRDIEESFLDNSKILLKFEWKRVKRGEKNFILTKYILYAVIALCAILFVYLLFVRPTSSDEPQTFPRIYRL